MLSSRCSFPAPGSGLRPPNKHDQAGIMEYPMTSYPGKHDRLWRPATACTVAVRRSDCPNSRSITRRAARTRYFMVSRRRVVSDGADRRQPTLGMRNMKTESCWR